MYLRGVLRHYYVPMEQMAAERGVTVAQIALNYIICKGAIPIPGARTAAQYTDNNGALGWRLSTQEVDILENEADSLGISFDGAGTPNLLVMEWKHGH